MIDYAVMGVIQGLFEWLPVSSKTAIMLFSSLLGGEELSTSYSIALSLQAGTVVSAVLYFRRELLSIRREGRLLLFLAIATAVTGVVGGALYYVSKRLLAGLPPEIPTALIGIALMAQAFAPRREGSLSEIRLRDSLVLGLSQGLAALPGISRSGVTIAALLALGYEARTAMRLSFLASIPANAGAIALVALSEGLPAPGGHLAVALVSAALVGYASMGILLELAARRGRQLTLLMGLLAVAAAIATLLK